MNKVEGPDTVDALRHYAAIIRSSEDAIISKTLDSIITSWNPAAERMFGYSGEEAVGQSVLLIIPEDRRDEEAYIMQCLRGGTVVHPFDTVRRRKDGELVDASVSVSPIYDPGGRVVGGSQIARDISPRKRSELERQAALREVTNLKTALDAHAIVAITDRAGNITYVNDKFCSISQYSRQELIGKNHRVINSGYHPREFFTDLWGTIASGLVWKGQIKNRAKDGSLYWVDTTIVPFLDRRGNPEQYIAVRTDITLQKIAVEQLQAREQALVRVNSALEEFAYVASHDLQEPLRGVAGCIQLLKKNYGGKLDARADEFIRHAVMNVERMQTLILGLLDYTRIERKGSPMQQVDASSILRDAVANLSVAIQEAGAEIVYGDLPEVYGDPRQLWQLLQNLIGNAIKFRGPEPPRIEIAAQAEAASPELLTFSVSDNGIGIDPRHAERIFGLFQRLHRRETYPGTGLGLAICRKIVERHGGKIWAEPNESGGTVFKFTLPRVAKDDISGDR